MYSISSINEGKYKILSDSLVGVFNQVDRSVKPIPIGEERPRTTEPDVSQVEDLTGPGSGEPTLDPLERIAQSMRETFGELIANDQLTIRGNELWIEIELSSSLLFPSGDALPNDQAFQLIDRLPEFWLRSTTRSTSKASPTICPSVPTSFRPTGSCLPRVPAAWFECWRHRASIRPGWPRWGMVSFSLWRTMRLPRDGRGTAVWCW